MALFKKRRSGRTWWVRKGHYPQRVFITVSIEYGTFALPLYIDWSGTLDAPRCWEAYIYFFNINLGIGYCREGWGE